MVQRALENEDGYTIVEILVAITIVSIVMGIVGSVFIFVSRQMNRWQGNTRFYNEYEIIQNRVFYDVLSAESVNTSDSTLVLKSKTKYTEYLISPNQLVRNGEKVSVVADTVFLKVADDLSFSFSKAWELEYVAGSKKIHQEFILHSRKPMLWEPLNKRGN